MELGFWIAPVAAVVIVGLCAALALLHSAEAANGATAAADLLAARYRFRRHRACTGSRQFTQRRSANTHLRTAS